VLAAGEGSRLRPLTDRVPKPLLPIDGEPVLGRVLRQLRANGVQRVTMVIGYLGDEVRRFVASEQHGLDIAFVVQDERRGTGHALQLALASGIAHEDSVVAASDTAWRDEDVRAIVESAPASLGSVATMALLRWPAARLPHGFAVRVNEAMRVERVLERIDASAPDAPSSARSGSPLYVLRAPMWARIEALEQSAGGVVQLADALQAAIDAGEPVDAVEVFGARDLTRPDDLLRANFPYLDALLRGR
jgi:bifunctional UDP-N-acetylglucosamine pyrophosphorylase/glucosamine-1-phosphate N-acetyltransferase